MANLPPFPTLSDAALLALLQRRRSPAVVPQQMAALQEVQRRYGGAPLAEHPLRPGAHLGYRGQTAFGLRDLGQRLRAQGMALTKGVQAETTHVLIGPKLDRLGDLAGKVLVLDRDVQAFLDRVETPYLQQQKYTPLLRDLLLSHDPADQLLALAYVERGGFPTDLLAPAFVVYKTSTPPRLRQALKGYLLRYLPPEQHEAVHRNYPLANAEEYKITRNLTRYAKLLGPPDTEQGLSGLAVARVLFEYHRTGFQYLWRTETDPERLRATFLPFIDGTSLGLGERGITRLSKALGSFTELERVDLSGNRSLKSFPMELSKLPRLRELLLHDTGMEYVGSYLYCCPALRILHLGPRITLDGHALQQFQRLDDLHLYGAIALSDLPRLGFGFRPKDKEGLLKKHLPHTRIHWH